MENLEKELKEMLEIFDYFKLPEEIKKEIIEKGVYFYFNEDDSQLRLSCLRFANLLKMVKNIDPNYDVEDMLKNGSGDKYYHLIKLFLEREKEEKPKQRIKQ